jgi:multiple sugar transport system permease protein
MAYFIPAIAPAIAVTVLWKYIWQPDYGLANYLFGIIGLSQQMWLNDPDLVYWCMYFPGLIIAGGMSMLIYLAAMQEVPTEQYESALLDGAGFLHRVRYILLPYIMPIVRTMFILDIINRFNEINVPLVMTGGGPIGKTQTLILYAYKLAIDNQDYSYAIAIANVVFVLIFIVTAIQIMLDKSEDEKAKKKAKKKEKEMIKHGGYSIS